MNIYQPMQHNVHVRDICLTWPIAGTSGSVIWLSFSLSACHFMSYYVRVGVTPNAYKMDQIFLLCTPVVERSQLTSALSLKV